MSKTGNGNGIVTAPCYRCGKEKIASINDAINPNLDISLLEMVKMGWGRHAGQFRCNPANKKTCDAQVRKNKRAAA